MRLLPTLILTAGLLLAVVACQGDPGPAGEQGEQGSTRPARTHRSAWAGRTRRAYRTARGRAPGPPGEQGPLQDLRVSPHFQQCPPRWTRQQSQLVVESVLAESAGDGAAAPGVTINPVIYVSGTDINSVTLTGAGFRANEGVILTVANTAFAAVVQPEGSLMRHDAIVANETGAFSVTGSLPLGPGIYTLVATGKDSRTNAVYPLVIQ